MLNLGDRVDRYVVEAFVGEGGLARVYRVRHENLGGEYALKMLSFRGSRLSKRLVREGRIQARLQHPNIVRVHDAFELDGRGALLMEYVEGPGLDQVLNTKGPFPLQEALHIFGQVLAGVGAAHEAGVLHRDLKPGNILLQTQGDRVTAKVTDFGIARVLSAQHAEGDTLQSDVIGTPGYMAPEQASDPTQVDVRADLFSLGAILYGMVTGWPPFPMSSLAEVLAATERGDFASVRARVPDCPDRVVQVIDRCLAPNPDDRFGSCRMVAAALFGEESAEFAALDRASDGRSIGLAEADSEETRLPRASTIQSEAQAGTPQPKTLDEVGSRPNATVVPVPSNDPAVHSNGLVEHAPSSGARWGFLGLLLLLVAVLGVFAARTPHVASDDAASGSPVVAPAPAPPTVAVPGPVVSAADPPERLDPGTGGAAAAPAPKPLAKAEPRPSPSAQEALRSEPISVPGPVADEPATPKSEPLPLPSAPAAPPEPEPEPEPSAAVADLGTPEETEADAGPPALPAPASAPASVVGSWSGRLGGRASKLRVTGQEGSEVRAVFEVLQGTAYRTFRMVGTLEGDRLRLRGTKESPWLLDARLVGGSLEGDLTAPGRKKATAWRATRD